MALTKVVRRAGSDFLRCRFCIIINLEATSNNQTSKRGVTVILISPTPSGTEKVFLHLEAPNQWVRLVVVNG